MGNAKTQETAPIIGENIGIFYVYSWLVWNLLPLFP